MTDLSPQLTVPYNNTGAYTHVASREVQFGEFLNLIKPRKPPSQLSRGYAHPTPVLDLTTSLPFSTFHQVRRCGNLMINDVPLIHVFDKDSHENFKHEPRTQLIAEHNFDDDFSVRSIGEVCIHACRCEFHTSCSLLYLGTELHRDLQ